MEPIIEEFTISLKYRVTVDTETGEMTTKCINRTIDKSNLEVSDAKKSRKKVKKEESSIPQLILEDNKYILNTAAIELMGVAADDKLDIKYEKNGKTITPVIGNDEAFGTKGGNRLTKSNSVACRGSKHDELFKYGTIFEIKPHENKEGLFTLLGDSMKVSSGNEDINIDNLDEYLPIDADLSSITGDKDVEEIDSNYFQL